jgi:hypothetical protein
MTSTDRGPGDVPHHYTDAEMHNPDVAHEEADVDIRTVLSFAGGLTVVVLVAAALMWLMFQMLEAQAARNDPQLSPLALPAGQQPPVPRLLEHEPETLLKFRMEETKKLEGYGWVDEKAGVARVPIEEAKKLIVQRGLPVRASGAVEDARMGTHAAAYGGPSGGRAIAIPRAPAAGQLPAAAPPPGGGDIKK